MRIVGGKYRHRIIIYPDDASHTRPTKDRVREAIFSALGDISGARVLDLYAGSGAMGLEALSRGASIGYFVDKSDLSIKVVKKNCLTLGIDNARVMQMDYFEALNKFIEKEERFDIIVLDPPYASGYYNNIIKMIYENELIADSGVLVVESEGNISYDDFAFIKSRRYHYGKTYVDLLRRN